MATAEKVLTITPAAWSDEAARVLAASIRRAPSFGVADYRAALDQPGAMLYRVAAEGEPVGYVILRLVHQAHGTEGEILAAAGRLAGADLTRDVLPQLERMFAGVSAFTITTARRGLVAKLAPLGYAVTHYTLRKPA